MFRVIITSDRGTLYLTRRDSGWVRGPENEATVFDRRRTARAALGAWFVANGAEIPTTAVIERMP